MKLRELLENVINKKRGLLHYNVSTYEQFKAGIEAVKETKIPLIIGVSEGERNYLGINYIEDLVDEAKEQGINVFLNADHCKSFKTAKEAIDYKFDSVLFDGSELNFKENILRTKKVVNYRDKINKETLIEGEIGYLAGHSDKEIVELKEEYFTDPDLAEEFVNKTKVDLLAISVGNIHGIPEKIKLKGREYKKPRIDYGRIQKIKYRVKIPLVLHGGSGLNKKDFILAIKNGVSIIHINTEFRIIWKKELIKNLNKKIEETKKSINLTEEKIKKSKNYLLVLLRYYYQLKQRSIVEVFLAEANLSDYFSQFYYLQKVQESINNELDNLKELNEILNKQKTKLENQLEEQNNLLMLSKIKYQELQELKNEKNKLLAQAQKLEREYSKKLEESERTAAQIRQEIYKLAGGTGPITFGEAYEYAKIVEKYTGVRPAFLLAILHYESKLGQNVGTCHYKDAMKPSERPIFEKIVQELGLDPNKMPVSCKPWYGWGGAMGPAQFIPSTWMKYKERIARITGNNPPSPWNILDSFVAAGLYLKDAGADAKSYSAEWKAAMIYFAGSNWNNPSLRFYGDDVMSIAQRFEEDIKILERGK